MEDFYVILYSANSAHCRSEEQDSGLTVVVQEHFLKQMSIESNEVDDDNISCLLSTNLEFSEENIPVKTDKPVEFLVKQEMHTVGKLGAEQGIKRV